MTKTQHDGIQIRITTKPGAEPGPEQLEDLAGDIARSFRAIFHRPAPEEDAGNTVTTSLSAQPENTVTAPMSAVAVPITTFGLTDPVRFYRVAIGEQFSNQARNLAQSAVVAIEEFTGKQVPEENEAQLRQVLQELMSNVLIHECLEASNEVATALKETARHFGDRAEKIQQALEKVESEDLDASVELRTYPDTLEIRIRYPRKFETFEVLWAKALELKHDPLAAFEQMQLGESANYGMGMQLTAAVFEDARRDPEDPYFIIYRASVEKLLEE